MVKYFLIFSVVFLASCTNNSGSTESNNSNPTTSQVMIPSPTYGSGKHTLTIYADFQCPACIVFSEIVGPIFDEYAEKWYVMIEYKQFPLTSIHPNALRDALAWLCGAEQWKYTDYKKALYAMEKAKAGAKVSDGDRINAAKGILDEVKLAECLKSDRYLSQVQAEIAEGDAIGVNGTPTVFLDGKKLDAKIYSNPEVLRTILDRLLEVPGAASGSLK